MDRRSGRRGVGAVVDFLLQIVHPLLPVLLKLGDHQPRNRIVGNTRSPQIANPIPPIPTPDSKTGGGFGGLVKPPLARVGTALALSLATGNGGGPGILATSIPITAARTRLIRKENLSQISRFMTRL